MRFWKYIKRYKANSIFVKNFLISLLIILIPIMTINFLVFNYYTEKSFKESADTSLNELKSVRDNLDRIFRWISVNSDYMVNDTYVNMFLFKNYSQKRPMEIQSITDIVKGHLDKIRIAERSIDSVYLYSVANNYVLSTEGAGQLAYFYDASFMDGIKNLNFDREYQNISFVTNNKGDYIMRVQMPINLYQQSAGIICININYQNLLNTLEENISDTNSIIVMNKDSRILAIGDTENINIQKGKYIYQTLSSEQTGYEYVSMNTKQVIYFLPLIILLILLSLVFSFIAAGFITMKTCMPLGNLINIIENPKEWLNKSSNITPNMFGEVKYILENYIDKIYYSDVVEEKLANRLVELKQAQLDALGMQINPHFLFNTLQIVSMCATDLTGGRNDAVNSIELLSKILKYGLYSKDNIETVERELEYTKAYVELQKIRYNSRVNVIFDVDYSLLHKNTAKLVLQPLVENAYNHGIIPNKKKGTIIIRIYAKNNFLCMEIQDDGVGLSPSMINEINQNKAKTEIKKDKSIGLYNVNKRVELLFGEGYGVYVDGEYLNGAKFTIKQPLQ